MPIWMRREQPKPAEIEDCETFVQKGVDRLTLRPYRPVHRSGAALGKEPNCYGRQHIRAAVLRFQHRGGFVVRMFVVWLFDIVGFR